MIKINGRLFAPIKVAAGHVGYSVDWIRRFSDRYNFPRRVILSERKTGYWVDELDRWLARRARRRSAA